ncbi:hypothetical protein [Paenibacillus segetis]|uniref:Uncharacterized protein n=1 Tax=Paenibacillus segetis TaxID=1325360 RepID=A0ABQ1YDL6_9BACL|nr:hypothetical protein [Paenibacillus segetis]GGH22207.1 hypothetical protein GCM10008013_20560 [Paenibacillus segetis]
MKKLKYSFKTNGKGGSSSDEYMEPTKTVTFKSAGRSKGGAKLNQDEVIQLKVKWDDFEESFDLMNMQ